MQKIIENIIQEKANATSQQKGRELYKRGCLSNLHHDATHNTYTARVAGTKLYQVAVKMDEQNIPQHFDCSCPFDWGGLCKHQVTLLLALADLAPLASSSKLNKLADNHIKPLLSFDKALSGKLLKELFLPEILNSARQNSWQVNIIHFDRATMKVQVSHESFWTNDKREITLTKGNEGISTQCTCGNNSLLCQHIAAFIDYFVTKKPVPSLLLVFNPDFYSKKIEEGLKMYGLSQAKNPDEILTVQAQDGFLNYKLTKKYQGLIPIAEQAGEGFGEFFKQNILATRTPEFLQKNMQGERNTDQMHGFGLLFTYKPDNQNYFSIQAVTGKLSKKEDKFVGAINQIDLKNLHRLEPHHQEVLKQLTELDSETIFLHSHDHEERLIANSRLIPLLKKLFALHREKDLTFVRKEQYSHSYKINANSLRAVCLSQSPATVEFELRTSEEFIELIPSLVLGNNKVALPWENMTDQMVMGLMFLWQENLYLAENVDTLSTTYFFQEQGTLKTPSEQRDKFIQHYVMPLSRNFKVNMKDKKALKIKEVTVEPSKKQIYFREMGDFIILTPTVEYKEGHLQNILEKGNPIIEKNKQYISLIRDQAYETTFYDFIKKLHPKLNKQFPIEFFHLKAKDLLADDWFLTAFNAFNKENIEVFGFDKLKNFKYNPYPAQISTSVSSGVDWFEVNVNIAFGSTTVSLSEVRKAVLKKEKFVQLSDGSLGILPAEWLQKFERMFRQGEIKDNILKISSRRFMIVDSLFNDIDNKEVLLQLQEKKNKLATFSSIGSVKTPKEINATLRDYQREGLNWLNFLDEYQWGGILADDMGLGKTLQILSFLALQKKRSKNPNLIVVPTSLVFNWENEIKKFCPSMKVYFHYGPDRQKDTAKFKGNQLIITTYGTLVNDIEFLKSFGFHYIILDESQAIKNMQSLRFKAVRLLKGQNKLALTGTPIENNTFDLYAQMQFVNPGFLGSAKAFKEQFSQPIDRDNNPVVAAELKSLLVPFMIRRTKEQVAKELPPKTEEVLFCTMPKKQREVYDAYRNKYRDYLLGKIEEEGLEKSKIYVLEGLTKLRQICDSPAILSDYEEYGSDSVKVEELLRNIREKTGRHKVIVFSQFVKMLQLIKTRLVEENICFEYLDGKCSSASRKKSVATFQEDEDCRVFLISLKAGGTGLNLTAADYVFLVDPWWNPAVENQAIDRCYRIGQTKRVFAYRMICKDSVEEKILEYQSRKMAVANEVVQAEENFMKKLSFEDIKNLFE